MKKLSKKLMKVQKIKVIKTNFIKVLWKLLSLKEKPRPHFYRENFKLVIIELQE